MFARHLRVVMACIALGLACIPAGADTYRWTNDGGGDFSKEANWTPLGPPGPADLALFDIDSATYIVDVTGDHTVDKLEFGDDVVTLDITPTSTLAATAESSAVVIGRSGQEPDVTLTGGGTLDVGGSFFIAGTNGSAGTLTVANGYVLTSSELDVGSKGRGTLVIQSAGSVECGQVIIGSFSAAVGDATVDGGRWDCGANFTIGWDNVGSLTACNGAAIAQTATGKVVFVGRTATAHGTALIEGATTTWETGAEMRIGSAGAGELTLRDGATISGTNASIGAEATGSGTVTVDGGQWGLSGVLHVGYAGAGELTLRNGATISGNNATLGTEATGSGTVTVDGGQWGLTGDLSIGGRGTVAGGSGFMNVQPGSTVTVGGQTKLWSDGSLLLRGGTLVTGSLRTALGLFAWTGGELEVTGAGGLNVGPDRHVHAITLTAGKTLTVDHTLTVYDGGALSLAGGDLACGELRLAGGTVTTRSTVDLDPVGALSGYGVVNGPVTGGASVTITPDGAMTLGDADSTDGYNVAGTLAVGSNQVTLLDADRAGLGHTTTIGAGGVLTGLNGLRLDAGEVLTATGAALLRGEVLNDGTVNGPSAAGEALVFNDDVLGGGSYTGNIEFRQGFMPGNSPGDVAFGGGEVSFADHATLVMEILGTAGGQYDRLLDIGALDFQGDLQLIFGFAPQIGDSFDLLDFLTLTGSLDNVEVIGLDPALLDMSGLSSQGTVAVVPEPASIGLLMLGALAIRRRRRR